MAIEFNPSEVRIQTISRLNLDPVIKLNRLIFDNDHIIKRFDHEFMIILLVTYRDLPIAFKLGYGKTRHLFYSAKGGVLPAYQRRGIATKMLVSMMDRARQNGYTRFGYHTFPHTHPGMIDLGIKVGFQVKYSSWNKHHGAQQFYLERKL